MATHTTDELQHPIGSVINPVTNGVQSVDKLQILNSNSVESVEALPQSTRGLCGVKVPIFLVMDLVTGLVDFVVPG
nr:hypothetical protein CFP56_23743 [Quercus suber]